jgi:hypothetical protein
MERQVDWSLPEWTTGRSVCYSQDIHTAGGKIVSSKGKVPAIAYLRTSSAANVGADKDSDRRQREAIASFARRAGYELVAETLRRGCERR